MLMGMAAMGISPWPTLHLLMVNSMDDPTLRSLPNLPASARIERTPRGSVIHWDTRERRVAAAVRVRDAQGMVCPRVAVSDGENVALTDADGKATLDVAVDRTGLRFVFLSAPAGFRPVGPWFRMIPPDEERDACEVEFRLASDARPGSNDFRFLVTGDSQGSGTAWSRQLAEDYAEMSDVQGDPAFHVIVGDLAMTGWAEEWADYASARTRMRLRHFDLFGGHGGNYARYAGDAYADHGNIAHFHIACGPSWFSWDWGRFHCIALNAVASHYESAEAQERQRRWLRNDLALAGNMPILLFSHYPLDSLPPGLDLPLDRITANFYGHFHSNGVTQCRGVWSVRTAPLRGKDWGRLTAAMRVCDVQGDSLTEDLRPVGERRRLELPWPAGAVARGKTPVVALAFDTLSDVSAVGCLFRAGNREHPVTLRRSSQWTWRGDADLSAFAPGPVDVHLCATDAQGRTWQAVKTFTLGAEPAPSPRVGKDWPSLFRGAPDSGDEMRITPDDPKPPFRVVWTAQTGARNVLFASPILYQGRLYLGIQDERIGWPNAGLACYDPLTGREIWRTRLASIPHTPAARGGRIYAITSQAEACCLSADDGRVLWQRSFSKSALNAIAPAVLHGEHVLVGGWRHSTRLLHGETGEVLQEYPADPFMACAFTAKAGRVFGFERYKPQAYDCRSGAPLWAADERKMRYSAPPVPYGDAVLYCAGEVVALDAATGAVRWRCDAFPNCHAPAVPAIAGARAWVAGRLGCAELDLEKGDLIWKRQWVVPDDLARASRRDDPWESFSAPAATPSLVVVGDDTGVLRALARSDGRELWSWRIGIPIKSSPVLSGNMLFLQDYDGNLYGLVGT